LPRSNAVLARLGCLLWAASASAAGPPGPPDDPKLDLAIEDLNPLTRLYVLRFEDNVQFGFGPDD
jgi:hypothetical protein